MKKNDRLILNIEDLNNLGYGVAHKNGKTVFVSGAVDGDTCEVLILRDCGSYSVGKSTSVLIASPNRIEPACSATVSCGGCAYGAISYDHEKEIKRETVRSAFRRAGMPDVSVAPVVSDGKTEFYRNKAIIPIGYHEKHGFFSGFFAPKTHRIVPVAGCLLHKKSFTDITERAKSIMGQESWLFLTAENRPVIKSLYFRAAESGDIALTLILEEDRPAAVQRLSDRLSETFPQIVTVYTNLNPGDISTVLSPDFRLLRGSGYITDELCGAHFQISPASFYQVNRHMAELLYQKGAELLAPAAGELVCDLYCGIGSIGLSVFREQRLIGIETVTEAVDCARRNAAANGADAVYYVGDAAKVIEALETAPDCVILDPPRKGCTPELLSYLADKASVSRILYISCNPATLARDAHILQTYEYALSTVYPFDLFPRTGHVECVTLFTRCRTERKECCNER